MRPLGYRPELDGVRGLAILLVVANHSLGYRPFSWAFSGGGLGVDLFFVLSGFLITCLLLAEWERRGAVSLRGFWARRARRLLPALVTIVVLLALFGLPQARHAFGLQVFLVALMRLSYLANFFVNFAPSGIALGSVKLGLGHGFTHLWSLAQEEQFYLLWPLCLLALLRRGTGPKRLLLVVFVAIGAVNLDRIVVFSLGGSGEHIWNLPDTHGDAILFGCAAAVIFTYRLLRVPRSVGILSAAVAFSTVAWYDAGHTAELVIALPLFAAGSASLLLAVLDGALPRHLSAVFSSRPLRATGKVSYGLYLWHYPMLVFFGLAGLPFAVLATLLSYRYVETPLRRKRSSGSLDQLAVPATAVAD
jgi:peptidoglycan/LPS O-acetylase OafA/YrhL